MDVSAWIAIIAAVIAFLSAKGTLAQVAEARRQTELQRKIYEDSMQPYVWADISPDTAQGSLLKLTLCNEGPTAAANIHVTFDPPLTDVFEYRTIVEIQESIEAGISYLAPGRRVQWVLGIGHKFFEQEPTPTITISITCDGPSGPCPLNKYIVNIGYIRFSHDNPDGSLHRVAERIKDLTKTLKSRDSASDSNTTFPWDG